MRTRNVNFFNLVCTIIQFICIYYVSFTEDTSLDMFIVIFQAILLCVQFFINYFNLRKIRNKLR